MPSRTLQSIFLILTLTPLAFSTSPYYSDVEVVASDNNGVTFRFLVTDPFKYEVARPDSSGNELIRTILIGVPEGAKPFLSGARYSNQLNIDDSKLSGLSAATGAVAEIAGLRSIRGRQVATVNLYPYFQNVCYGEIEVTVNFEGAKPSVGQTASVTPDKVFDDMFGYSILNYEQFRSWPAKSRTNIVAKPTERPFAAATTWYKISITNEGLAKVSGQNLASAGISLGRLESDSIHLFYGGGEPLPVLNNIPGPSLQEIPISVSDGGDGRFDLPDYFIFFAEASSRWRYLADSQAEYISNPYTDTNYYWLAVSGNFAQPGKRMSSVDGAPLGAPDTVITTARFNVRLEQNRTLAENNDGGKSDYYTWYWTEQNPFTIYASLAHAVAAESALVLICAKAGNVSLTVNDNPAQQVSSSYPDYQFVTRNLVAGSNRLAVAMTNSFDSRAYLDFCEISYLAGLAPSGDKLDFAVSSVGGALAQMLIDSQFSSLPYILNITDPTNPAIVTGASTANKKILYNSQLVAGSNTRFLLTPLNKAFSPARIEGMPSPLIPVEQADMIIIAPRGFRSYLENYRAYRARTSGVTVQLVSVEDIMNEFSFGLYDPTAIRDFLKYAYENYPLPAPSAVLLVGDGNYDFENHLGTMSENLVPPYVHRYDSTVSDDNFVYFGAYGLLDADSTYPSDRGFDMMISRWPVRNTAELDNVIHKAEAYEASTNFGPWRATVTLVADDEFGAYDTETFHTRQTENLQKYHLPAPFHRNKIYLWDYPFDSNREKPLVNQAIIRSINDGSLMVNYVGHGNPDTWAHEHVFNRTSDLSQLNNSERLTLVFSASCSIGFFDDPTREGMAEDLIRLPNGGAIGTVSATRLVFAGENADFNQQVFDILFGPVDVSICQAVFTGKLLRQYNGGSPHPVRNDRAYAFFGDPLLKLGTPQFEVKFSTVPDSLLALAKHDITGEIVDKNSGSHVSMDGSLDVVVYDSDIQKRHRVLDGAGHAIDSLDYTQVGPVIYRGSATVTAGNFEFSFIPPLDIGYGGNGAKISCYAKGALADAFGLADSIPVSSVISVVDDSAGPSIQYTFGGRKNFISGDRINQTDSMNLTLSDPVGLNLSGAAGHGITLVVDNQVENIINMTDLFQYDAASFATGRINYSMGRLTPGEHKFKIKAWDNANNSSVAEFTAQVLAAGGMTIADLLNYPNPMQERTTFSFTLTSPARKVSLEIFTLSGRKIKAFEKTSLPAEFSEFCSWDGRDASGDRVATGVYIYKVTAESEKSDEVVESFGKVVVIN